MIPSQPLISNFEGLPVVRKNHFLALLGVQVKYKPFFKIEFTPFGDIKKLISIIIKITNLDIFCSTNQS